MIKIICVFILILSLPVISYSQDCYTVLKVKGKIVLEKTGQQIKTNDEICSDDNLSFYSNDAAAVVHSVSKGRFTVKAYSNRGNELNDIIKFSVSSVLSSTKTKLSTKSLEKSESEINLPFFIVGKYMFKIDEKQYPINDDKYFFVRFSSGGETYNRKLKNSADTLIMDKESILNTDDKILTETRLDLVRLYYFDKTANTTTLISKFDIIIADETILKDELNNYAKVLRNQNLNKDEILSEILDYVSEIYGQTDAISFSNWIKSNLDL